MKKIILVLIIAALVAPMFIKGPDGEPIMRLSDWTASVPQVTNSAPATPAEYYRYRDESGNWQYTDRPRDGVEYELVEIDTSSNTMESVVTPSGASTVPADEPAAGVTGYVQNLQRAKQEAEQVQQIMDDREGRLDEVLQQSQ
ncbi:MAG: DUF4124 domain-containing protein [Porticoccaceae bacterium]